MKKMLFLGHAYSITQVADVKTDSGTVTIIRCLSRLISFERFLF